MRLLGAVLSGGQARRFGADKAQAVLRGRPLLAHVVDALAPQVAAVACCGRAWPGTIALADRPGPGLGPLGGLSAALHHAAGHGFDAVLSVPCDAPALPPDLAALLGGGAEARCLADMPVIGVWPAGLASLLDRHLAEDGRRSMRGWAAYAGARAVTLEAAIPNVNTPADLRRLADAY